MQSELREKLPELPWDSAEEPRLIWKGGVRNFLGKPLGYSLGKKNKFPTEKLFFWSFFWETIGKHPLFRETFHICEELKMFFLALLNGP
jgi:hypothetical protein